MESFQVAKYEVKVKTKNIGQKLDFVTANLGEERSHAFNEVSRPALSAL